MGSGGVSGMEGEEGGKKRAMGSAHAHADGRLLMSTHT